MEGYATVFSVADVACNWFDQLIPSEGSRRGRANLARSRRRGRRGRPDPRRGLAPAEAAPAEVRGGRVWRAP
jgi:hypothetical protein